MLFMLPSYFHIKIGIPHCKEVGFICLNEISLKMIKNDVYKNCYDDCLKKFFLFLRYIHVCPNFKSHIENGSIRNSKSVVS